MKVRKPIVISLAILGSLLPPVGSHNWTTLGNRVLTADGGEPPPPPLPPHPAWIGAPIFVADGGEPPPPPLPPKPTSAALGS
jgi:hypothetical protein